MIKSVQSSFFSMPLAESFALLSSQPKVTVLNSEKATVSYYCSDKVPESGSLLVYRLSYGLSQWKWEAVVEQFEEKKLLVTRMIKGPFKSVQCRHEFGAEGNGTLIRDEIELEFSLKEQEKLIPSLAFQYSFKHRAPAYGQETVTIQAIRENIA